jgi:mannose-6-phosphate isomerase
MDLYPMLMVPEFYSRPWGARDLAPIYDRHVHPGEQPIGEAWLTGDNCLVANGPLTGKTLGEATQLYGRSLSGSAAPDERFPLLIKLIFPREKLSVQVHPDDELARQLGLPCGKTECWYVLETEPGAEVAVGVKQGVTREQFREAIAQTRAEELLNWVGVHPSEMILVDAGTVHAIGPGVILLETQQNSDTTFRLYDYGRPRPLHVEEGLRAMRPQTAAGTVAPVTVNGYERLIESPYFVVEKVHLEKDKLWGVPQDPKSVQVLVATEGCGVVECPGNPPVTFSRGDAVVIPASAPSSRLRPQWNVEFLRARLP